MRRQPMQVGSQFSGTHKADDRYIGSLYKKYNLDRLIRLIFANGEQGVAYDPNDLTTLFQDAAGTIPVTSTGQPVGLVLDKSKGLKLGAELFIESDVSIAGQSSKLDGTRYRVYCPDGIESSGIRLMGKFIAGKWYLVEFTIDSVAVAGEGIAAESTQNQLVHKTVGRKRVLVLATNANFYLKRIGVCDYTVSSISVKEIAGNHAYQTVSASRPILRQTPILSNELVVNGDFSGGLTNVAPRNVVTLEIVSGALKVTNTGTYYGYGEMALPTEVGKLYLLRGDVVASSGAGAAFHIASLPNSSDIATNVEGAAAAAGVMFTAKTTTTYLSLKTPSNATGAWRIFDNISIKEITGYRTDQNYLAFDGVDDFLITNNVDFTATDKISIFASVRKFSDALQAVVVELGSGVFLETKGAFTLYAPASAAVAGYRYLAQGNTAANMNVSSDAVYAAPNTAVLTASSDILTGDIGLRVSGTPSSAKAGAIGKGGKHINAPLYVGRRTGSVLSLSGNIYGLIIVGRLTTGDETSALERILATDAGVTLNV